MALPFWTPCIDRSGLESVKQPGELFELGYEKFFFAEIRRHFCHALQLFCRAAS
jgi:hypothetical protein